MRERVGRACANRDSVGGAWGHGRVWAVWGGAWGRVGGAWGRAATVTYPAGRVGRALGPSG